MRSKISVWFILAILLLGAGLLIRFYLYPPRAAQDQLRLAAELIRSGDDRAAIVRLQKLAAPPFSDPVSREVALLLARALNRIGDQAGAAALWGELAAAAEPDLREEAAFNLALAESGRTPVAAAAALAAYLELYPDSPRRAQARLALARQLLAAGDQAGAEAAYRRVVSSPGPEEVLAPARKELGEINLSWLWSRGGGPGTITYTVRSGDSLGAIAGRYRTTPDLIRRMNRLSGDVIQPGQTLLLPGERFSVLVSKSKNNLILLYGGEFFKEYAVGTGRDNCSPAGEFTIVTKLIDPPWFYQGEVIPPFDERNILGTRWMGFDDPYASFGIHGTTQPETIGTQSSDGCVRMRNQDVEELFIFLPRGARVVIEE